MVDHPHPDPEGHLTDITISAIRDLRDTHRQMSELLTGSGPIPDLLRKTDASFADALNAILEPWGEATITDD